MELADIQAKVLKLEQENKGIGLDIDASDSDDTSEDGSKNDKKVRQLKQKLLELKASSSMPCKPVKSCPQSSWWSSTNFLRLTATAPVILRSCFSSLARIA